MEALLFILIPGAIAGLTHLWLNAMWPKETEEDAKPAKNARPKASSRDAVVDGAIAREDARKEERSAAAQAANAESFEVPPDFDFAEIASRRD